MENFAPLTKKQANGAVFSLLNGNQIFGIGQRQDPITECVPLGQLVGAAGIINIDKIFVIQRHGAHLIEGGGQQLDHIVPGLLLVAVLTELHTLALKIVNERGKHHKRLLVHAITAEILALEGLDLKFGCDSDVWLQCTHLCR